MSLTSLDTQLGRLSVLPNTMNYKGLWAPTEQYYQNDVVIGLPDNALYILVGATALIDGGDPSTNPQWDILSSAGPANGVDSVVADPALGIENTGTAKDVILRSTGVISILTDPDTGIENTGTAQNQVLVNTGILSIETDTLTGIRNDGTTQDQILVNTGVLTVGAQNGCTNTGSAQQPVIENLGVLTVVAQNGCTNTGSAQNPIIESTGVQSISVAGSGGLESTPEGGGIEIGGTSSAVTVAWAPLASGVARFDTGVTTVEVLTAYTLTPDTCIMLTPYREASVGIPVSVYNSPFSPAWNLSSTTPTNFEIVLGSYTPVLVNNYILIKWVLLSV